MAEEKREALDNFSRGCVDVEGLANAHPGCACESAATVVGGHGQIGNNEILRFFLTSRSDIDGKKASRLAERRFRARSLTKAYTQGLSVCRLSYACRCELNYTAKILHEIMIEKDGKFGGILGVVDFPAAAVRQCPAETVPMCVHETPLDPNPNGGFFRPSHADIVNSQVGMTDEEKKKSREIVFNQIHEQKIQKKSEDITDCDLCIFLPEAVGESANRES